MAKVKTLYHDHIELKKAYEDLGSVEFFELCTKEGVNDLFIKEVLGGSVFNDFHFWLTLKGQEAFENRFRYESPHDEWNN